MRILHILPSLNEAYGGPLRLVLDLSARACSHGLQSEVAGVNQLRVHGSPLPESAIHSFAGGNEAGFAHSPALQSWLDLHISQYDAAAIHGAWHHPGWAAYLACKKHSVPYAFFPHGMLERWAVTGQGLIKHVKKRIYWRLRERHIANSASRVFFTTLKEQELTRVTFPVTAQQEILSVYGIEEPERVPAPARTDLHVPEDARLVLFLGRLHPKKNVPFLLQCWRDARVPEPWMLVVAGSGEPGYEAHIRQLARRYGIQDRVCFPGFVAGQDKGWLLQRADWYLLPSSQENFGIAVLEAVANGCAVAITDRVYLAEAFRSESEVLPLEPQAWVDFLATRMQNPSHRDQTAAADRAHLLNAFRMDSVVMKWAEAFHNLRLVPSSV
jgi:glycosyltransferase involved in cell wall biosynthesis